MKTRPPLTPMIIVAVTEKYSWMVMAELTLLLAGDKQTAVADDAGCRHCQR